VARAGRARVVLALVALSACARPEGGLPALGITEYLCVRLGANVEPGVAPRWHTARLTTFTGEGTIAVCALGGVLMTEDGERLPAARLDWPGEFSTDETNRAPRRHVPGNELELWQQFAAYRELSPATREWLRNEVARGAGARVAAVPAEFVQAEVHRIQWMMRDQSTPWAALERASAALATLARAGGAPADALAQADEFVAQMRRCSAFAAETAAGVWSLAERTVRSEIESSADVWAHRHEPLRGRFTASYGDLQRVELRPLLRYWESAVWTRDVVVVGTELKARTLGERVRAIAERLLKKAPCSRADLEAWITGR
jgi:hypothetical protein